LAIGDAAGHQNPLTGVGIQYGMDAAKIAAQTLVEGFALDDLSAGFLEKYHQKIQERFGQTFRISRVSYL
jgi:flavin-dependent dehydrogenase